MDAYLWKAVVLTAALSSFGASYRTQNFVVTAPTPELAEKIGRSAEQYRRELAIEWLGKEMPNWAQPCPITAHVAEHLGAGGATSFLFDHGEVFGWQMTIQGSQLRILDSVLPHEVTHTIFATHFRQPLPRWADEGACTTVEHASERAKQQTMLVDFLRTGRGISFSRMFAMKEYPHDVMPLYSQGYSLARYLIAQRGKREFLNFVSDGLKDENWTRAIKTHYGYDNLAMLQNTWLDWVRQGSPTDPRKNGLEGKSPAQLAQAGRRDRPEPNLIYRAQSPDEAAEDREQLVPVPSGKIDTVAATEPAADMHAAAESGWHPRFKTPDRFKNASASAVADRAGERQAASGEPAAHQVTRPQPVQKSRQIILEWSRQPGSPPPADEPAAIQQSSVYARNKG